MSSRFPNIDYNYLTNIDWIEGMNGKGFRWNTRVFFVAGNNNLVRMAYIMPSIKTLFYQGCLTRIKIYNFTKGSQRVQHLRKHSIRIV